jgi:hypothetical protein
MLVIILIFSVQYLPKKGTTKTQLPSMDLERASQIYEGGAI